MKNSVFILASCLMLAACGSEKSIPETKAPKAVVKTPIAKPVTPKAVVKSPIAKPVVPKTVADVKGPSLENGAKFFKKCAACHLPTGKGVKGAFPPLTQNIDGFAQTPEGRKYLTLALIYGVQGKIEIDGVKYSGLMAAQARNKPVQTVADTLNYILTEFYPDQDIAEFTADEVQKIKTDAGKVNGKAVRALRPE